MQKFIWGVIFISAISLFASTAKAEAYFLKIQQEGIGSQKNFLQTCSRQTSPCTFMMPIQFKRGISKNLLVVIRFKDSSPFTYLQFYWDQTVLRTNSSGEDDYKLFTGTPEIKVLPSLIELYQPLTKEPHSDAVEMPFVKLKAQVTIESE